MKFGNLQSLVDLELSSCSKLGRLPDSIVELSKLETFNLRGGSKLENLLVKFGNVPSLVEFKLSGCSKFGGIQVVGLFQVGVFT
jgi:hypothetical protein